MQLEFSLRKRFVEENIRKLYSLKLKINYERINSGQKETRSKVVGNSIWYLYLCLVSVASENTNQIKPSPWYVKCMIFHMLAVNHFLDSKSARVGIQASHKRLIKYGTHLGFPSHVLPSAGENNMLPGLRERWKTYSNI